MLSVLHEEDLVGTEKNGKPDYGDEREEQQRVHEACGKQLFEHDKVQAMDQGAQQSSQHKKFVHLMKVRRTTVDVPLGVMEVSLRKP